MGSHLRRNRATGGRAVRAVGAVSACALLVFVALRGVTTDAAVRVSPQAGPAGGPLVTVVTGSTATTATPTKIVTKAAAPRPQVLNPGTLELIERVVLDERQLASLDAYGQARADLEQAEANEAQASAQLAVDMAAWQEAKAEQHEALLAQASATQQVLLYERALYELGVAEYTGQTMISSSNLREAQHELVVAQFGEVAAIDEHTGLDDAQLALAAAEDRVRETTALVAFTGARAQVAKHVFVLAEAQLARSRQAVLVARQWALAPEEAPARPGVELVLLEQPVPGPERPAPAELGAQALKTRRGVLVAGPERSPMRGPPITGSSSPVTTSTIPATGGKPSAAKLDLAQLRALGPTILGPSLLTAVQVQAWWASTGAVANTTVPIDQLVNYYMGEGRLSGVRADIAFAQSVVETGYFSFPAFGQDPASYNNFAGIGACDTCKHGFRYPSAVAGAQAQQQLLEEYALPYQSPTMFAQFGVSGSSQTWMALSGVWATNINYGYAILSVYKLMLEFVIQGNLQRFSLVPSVKVPTTPSGPTNSVKPLGKSSLTPSHSPQT